MTFTDLAKSFLRGEHQAEEAVLIHLLPVQLRHRHRHGGQGCVVHEEKKCLKRNDNVDINQFSFQFEIRFMELLELREER